ncbi:organic solvent ABC transporter [Lysobacter arseniciresistens ZS79]|uniref:Organic solvent ABC transporter n=1 Tax=Lysobacter arseniciresistens ZS79 TaxID=913325 RepID=A0A0A0F0T6_9GAMM|nr:ABC transporter substrate-binding protein [Lysobacter arseniciresistens]KGM56786.1 organic solvent ABC transporter [Lysobacter arseniciresistens ZS79]
MKRNLIALFVSAALLAAAPATVLAQPQAASAASTVSPSKLVLDNSTRILTTLEERRDEFRADRGALRTFIASEFDNMFDRTYAARLVLGRHGRGASDAEVGKFADALANSLMARYGSSLLDFNSQLKVRVKSETPLRGGAMVKVSSEFLREGGEPVPVDYLLRRNGNDWKVFDVMVEGVSFVQTFRNQFDGPLSRQSIAEVAAQLETGKLKAGTD